MAKPKKMCFGLSQLNPSVEKNYGEDFGVILACFKNSGWAGSTRIFEEKNGLSRLNSNFWRICQVEPDQPDFWSLISSVCGSLWSRIRRHCEYRPRMEKSHYGRTRV